MSIVKEAYSVCKHLRKGPNYGGLGKLILGINFSAYGQAARNIGHQFLGMLMVNQEIDKFSIKLDPLDVDELVYLESIHRELVELNKDCVKPLVDALPEIDLAVDPNSKYIYKNPTLCSDFTFLEDTSREGLVSAFHEHPGINRFLTLRSTLGEEIDREHYLSDVLDYRDKFLSLGPLREPKWFDDLNRLPENAPRRLHNLLMFTLLCIQDSLYNLNQLIFQAFIQERFTIIDKNCLIDMGPNVGNGVGRGIGALFQTAQFTLLDDMLFGNLIQLMLMADAYGTDGNTLVRVEAAKKSMQPLRHPCYAEFRFLDDNLNSFPRLLRL